MSKIPCDITYKIEDGIKYFICRLAAKVSGSIERLNDPINLYNKLEMEGCPNPDCIYRSGRPVKENASLHSVPII